MRSDYFKDLTILELANVLAGPSVGMFFAELGARVIKIEDKRTGGDATRTWKQANEPADTRVSAYFSSVNYKKEYRLYNLSDPGDLEMVKKLAAASDIVISNFTQGKDKKYGLDYLSLKKINPEIIYGHITGFGEDNPRVAYDVVLQAETGLMYMTGEPGREPVRLPVAFIDILAAHQLKEGLLVALMERERGNGGSHVHVSLFDAAVSCLTNQAANYLMNGFIPERMGTFHPNIAPYGELVTTSDGVQIILAVGNDRQFTALCQLLKQPHLANEEKYKTNALRVINRGVLLEILQKAFSEFTSHSVEPLLLERCVPFGRIRTMKDVFETSAAKNMIAEERIEDRTTKRVKSVAFTVEKR